MRLTHGGLQVQRLDVLPVLFQQRNKEVDGQHDVRDQLIFSHTEVTDSNTETENLLQLELDGGTELVGLIGQGIVVRDGSRELTDLVETRTQETRNLLNQSFGSKESIVLLGELLDELLVLVKLLKIVNRLEFHTGTLGLITMESITENTDCHTGTSNVRELDGTRETLITLGIVVLQTNLEFKCFSELALLFSRGSLNLVNNFSDGRSADFTKTPKSNVNLTIYDKIASHNINDVLIHHSIKWMHPSFDGWMDGWMSKVIYLIVKEMKREGSTKARTLVSFSY